MNRDLPRTFGRSAADCARSAGVLAVLGIAAVWGLGRLLMRPESPLAAPFAAVGLPAAAVPVAGTLVVLGLAAFGYRAALRSRPVFRLTEQGLEVADSMGRYLLSWENLVEAGEAAGGALGLKIRDREVVLATHVGTAGQREWLRTLPAYGEWDYLYPRAELGRPVAEILAGIHEQQRNGKDTARG